MLLALVIAALMTAIYMVIGRNRAEFSPYTNYFVSDGHSDCASEAKFSFAHPLYNRRVAMRKEAARACLQRRNGRHVLFGQLEVEDGQVFKHPLFPHGFRESNDAALKIDIQLVDTASQTNIWSDHLQRERTDPTVVADEASRGIARMLAIEIGHLGVLRERANPISQLTIGELVARGYSELQMGTIGENLSAAMMLFDEALRRNPHYQPALLAVARVHIIAAMNFVDLDVASDLDETERVLNGILDKSPNSISALYSMALLQKYRGHYAASLRWLNRCLELNPSFLPAQGQVGDVLIKMGQPQQGLEQILQTIRAAAPNDPTTGYWYLFAAEADLELRHDQAALDWALRADTFMPGSPLVKAWLASIYATIGDKSNAAKYVAALTKMAPGRTQLFIQRTSKDAGGADNRHWPRFLDGLRLALSLSQG